MARQIRWRGVLSPDGAGDGRPEEHTWQPGKPLVPPRSIVESVRLMQFGAFLEVCEVLRGFLTRAELRDAIRREVVVGKLPATDADIEGVLRFTLGLTTIVAVAACVIWLALARATARGSRWARIIASVLLPVYVGLFAGALLPTAGKFAFTLAFAILFVGAWAVVRLWHRDSSAYIRYQNTPRD
ncbi:hypothetical protein SAMN04489867_3302 [Pedococcus dokdonensis]|uniref:Uncharacterized protein n=1 Tax=Pedococcus dokdonensis TaxID=443156 RepID=A0A1H0UG65_9MICO|nr:hypothetical protein [Pedococcus dokdonensis]SDP65123.1 hypothetical protein SAMN04489867_3302 [Pedococcus dokdonensis]